MVKEVKKGKEGHYVCEECNLAYKDKVMAKKCQSFCKKYKSCSIEITKHAIKIKG